MPGAKVGEGATVEYILVFDDQHPVGRIGIAHKLVAKGWLILVLTRSG